MTETQTFLGSPDASEDGQCCVDEFGQALGETFMMEDDEEGSAIESYLEENGQATVSDLVCQSKDDDEAVLEVKTGLGPDCDNLNYTVNEEVKMKAVFTKKLSKVKESKSYMCNYCSFTAPQKFHLTRHMMSHSDAKAYRCYICEKGFQSLVSLKNHVNIHLGIKPHKCSFCASCYTTDGQLSRHVKYIHTHEKPYKCPMCVYRSVELSKVRRHMTCHTGEKPYQCPHCTYASSDTFKLKRHVRIHTGEKPYECDICLKRFNQQNSVKAHRAIHSLDRPVYECELCPQTCVRKCDLRVHVQKFHLSEKPLNCKSCGKCFPDKYTLKVHNKTHVGEKCFKCDLCAYSSISVNGLNSHMFIHSVQKPFQCDGCDKGFNQKQLLTRHQNRYHNPVYIPPTPRLRTNVCPECGKSFSQEGYLKRHMLLHEKFQGLEIERKKKSRSVDGEIVDLICEEFDDVEDPMQYEEEYVYIEVIQMPDNGEGISYGKVIQVGDGCDIYDKQPEDEAIQQQQMPLSQEEIKLRKKQDILNCFGFDDESD
eukprot:GFUD01023782.1.p1 GENE.GFUD01023782.1~~GFUD01023782.1.p1  ORF type:complete len:537 (-),score=100.71 GFUD01023782.1:2-1612(-)